MLIEIWSDVVCPWCAVGRARFLKALESFEHRDQVEIRYRSFELDPAAPPERTGTMVQHLSKKYGMSVEEAQRANDHLEEVAALDGVEIHFDRMRAGNTFDAHRLLHLAHDRGVQSQLNEALLDAVFRDGRPVGDRPTLTEIAESAGLDGTEVRAVLEADTYGEDVREDEARAGDLDITGVPFFLIDGRFGVPGAQPVERFALALDRAWARALEDSDGR